MLEQILQLKVGCLNFSPLQDSAIYPKWPYMKQNFEQPTFNRNIYSNSTQRTSRLSSSHAQHPRESVVHDFEVVP